MRHEMKQGRTGRRTLLWISVLGIVGWALFVIVMFRDWSQGPSGSLDRDRVHEREQATEEGPPVIKLGDLAALGFSESLVRHIEPYFHVLNAALVTLVELHAQFDAESTAEGKRTIEGRAGVFHVTADMHEQRIESALPDPLKAEFHAYMRRKETAAGLPNEERWHLHEQDPKSRRLPKLEHGDSVHPRRDTINDVMDTDGLAIRARALRREKRDPS